MRKPILLLALAFLSYNAFAQKPETQVSFAVEKKPLSYYAQQAELWWKEIEKDKSSEESWYNYYKACRNAHGTANWKSNFVKASPYLKFEDQIISLMAEHIPNTFTFNYVKGANGSVDPTNGSYLLIAYEMNPDFQGIHSDMITYAVSTFNQELRKKVNAKWHERNEISAGLLNYAYNVLQSVEPNSILLTQGDFDTYPLWMLQDVLSIRRDVNIVCVDFLLLQTYKERIFKELNFPPLDIKNVDLNVYEQNWKATIEHLLKNAYNRNIYLGLTVSPELYSSFSSKLWISGLTLKLSNKALPISLNQALFEDKFLLDYVKMPLLNEENEPHVKSQSLNYLKVLKLLYDDYKQKRQSSKADVIKNLAIFITRRCASSREMDVTLKSFN